MQAAIKMCLSPFLRPRASYETTSYQLVYTLCGALGLPVIRHVLVIAVGRVLRFVDITVKHRRNSRCPWEICVVGSSDIHLTAHRFGRQGKQRIDHETGATRRSQLEPLHVMTG